MKIGIVGAGRAGKGLGLALQQAGHEVYLHGRRWADVPAPLVFSYGGQPPWLAEVGVIILAVQDHAIALAAAEAAEWGGVTRDHVVLHLSGILDEAPLRALEVTGAALGTMHPLQAMAAAETAAERLIGALAAITGDPRATKAAREIAESLAMVPVVIDTKVKAKYHAAAVIASNYLVVLAAVAEQLMVECGFDEETARRGLGRLMEGTLQNVARAGPRQALTGPVVRGDEETLSKHREVLPPRVLELYRALGAMAREMGRRDSRD